MLYEVPAYKFQAYEHPTSVIGKTEGQNLEGMSSRTSIPHSIWFVWCLLYRWNRKIGISTVFGG